MADETKNSLQETWQNLRALYDIRFFMQLYAKGQITDDVRQSLIEAYDLLANTPQTRQAAIDLIKEQVVEAEFNPYAYKTTTVKDDKRQKRLAKKSKDKNKQVGWLLQQIGEELAYQHSRGKMMDINEDAQPLKIYMENDGGTENFVLIFPDNPEPVKFKIKTYKNKHCSLLGASNVLAKDFGKRGFNQKTYDTLKDLGEQGIELTYSEEIKVKSRKYSALTYKKWLGLNLTDELSEQYVKELEILNALPQTEQQKFIEGVKARKLTLQKNKNFFAALDAYSNPIILLAQKHRLQQLFKIGDIKVEPERLQSSFINGVIKHDMANIWSKFTLNATQNSRFSAYDILQSNIISRYTGDFESIFAKTTIREARMQIKNVFDRMQNSMKPLLPSKMCAELLAVGIFKTGLTKPVTQDRLRKMNKFLNDFGVNVDFKTLPVTKVPDDCIETAAQQMKISRADFDKARNTIYKIYNKKLQYMVQSQNISNPDNEDLHHYIALKYDGFVDRVLNDTPNLVKTVREHPWNTDGHKLVHVFDTAGEFLVSDSKNNYYLLDFNALRKAFKQDKKLFIQAPILQIKQDGVFCDLLPVNNTNLGGMGCYISSDKTEQNYIKIPSFCLSEGRGGNFGKGGDGR